jgi:hypothetical protein
MSSQSGKDTHEGERTGQQQGEFAALRKRVAQPERNFRSSEEALRQCE